MKVSESGAYQFEAKDVWRKKIWNEIGRRVVNNRGATVLYLPGPDDLDRRQAMRKGFRASNLVAVDTDKSIVAKMKKQGKIAIHGKMSDVLLSWPTSRPIDVLIADTCNAISNDIKNMMIAIFGGKVSPGGIVLFNVQRGREGAGSMAFIDAAKDWHEKNGSFGACDPMNDNIANRSTPLLHLALISSLRPYGPEMSPPSPAEYEVKARQMKPRFNSYKSGVVMDSLLFTVYPEYELVECEKEKMKRKISSTLAVQTMRQNGKLPKSPRV